jgi:serine/threonine protein phosphatase PrpC
MFPSFLSSVIFGDKSADGRSRNEPITTKTTERGSVNESGMDSYAFSGMQGWRLTMEDEHMVCTSIPVEGQKPLPKGHAIFGVMDGHGGDFTSGFASDNFLRIFSQTVSLQKYASLSPEDQRDVPGIELLRPALSETFCHLDIEIRKKQNKRNDTVLMMTENKNRSIVSPSSHNRVKFERSGSTCVVVMVTPSHIICANAGDSRAVLRRNGKTLPLSFDHKPNNIPEHERITTAGGFVKSKRVDGDLAVSRGLGDFSYKSNESKTVELQKVIPDPEFVIYPRNPEQDEFMILACDGIWDVATNDQCSDFAQELLEDGESDLGLICEEAIDVCLDKNSRDNMTISMVTFEAAQIARGLKARNAVWQRRTSRQAKQFEISAKNAASRAAANVGFSWDSGTSTSSESTTSGSKRTPIPVGAGK